MGIHVKVPIGSKSIFHVPFDLNLHFLGLLLAISACKPKHNLALSQN